LIKIAKKKITKPLEESFEEEILEISEKKTADIAPKKKDNKSTQFDKLVQLVDMEAVKKSLEIDAYPLFKPRKDILYECEILSEISDEFQTVNGLCRSIDLFINNIGKRHIYTNQTFIHSLAVQCVKNEVKDYVGKKISLQKIDMKTKKRGSFEGYNVIFEDID